MTRPALLAVLLAAGWASAQPVTVAVDPTADRRAISPLIFGVNWGAGAQLSRMKFPVRRWGGTPTTRYNWQLNAWNAGNDYLYLNNAASPSADAFIDETRAAGSAPLMAVPILGWVAKDATHYGFSIAAYGPMHGNECSLFGNQPGCNADMGDGFHLDGVTPVAGNDPLDTSTNATSAPSLAAAWKAHIVSHTGGATAATGGVRFFGLDNEPMLWDQSHRDVHPAGVTYDEHWQKGRDVAIALKAADPAVQLLGPNEWGWCGWVGSSADYDAPGGSCFVPGPDATAHGGAPFSAWWLAQAKAYELANGTRLVDYFSLHYYPQGTGVPLAALNGTDPAVEAARLRALKELYDPAWTSEDWIGANGVQIALIPRMRQWIAANYPGTKLAIGEYNFGDVGVSSALAQAEALAIFGREGVDLALRWEAPADGSLVEDAYALFMNYDGAGATVSGESVRATSSNVDQVGAYAVRGAGSALFLLLFNKDTVAHDAAVTSVGGFTGSAQLFRFGPGRLASAGSVPPVAGALTITLPARSATLAVTAGTFGAGQAFYTLAPCRLLDTRNAAGPFGGPALSAGTPRSFTATSGACGVPAGAAALSVNVTAVLPTGDGYVQLWPSDAAPPSTSVVNLRAGQVRANNAVVGLSALGQFTAQAGLAAGAVDLLVDVNGYFR